MDGQDTLAFTGNARGIYGADKERSCAGSNEDTVTQSFVVFAGDALDVRGDVPDVPEGYVVFSGVDTDVAVSPSRANRSASANHGGSDRRI